MFSLFFARITFRRFFFSAKYTLLHIRQRSLMLGDFVKKTILTKIKIEPAEKPAQPLTKSDEESG